MAPDAARTVPSHGAVRGSAIGVDMGGSKCLSVAVGADGAVQCQSVRPTPSGAGPAEVIDALVDAVDACRGEAPDATAVGIGMPGLVTAHGVLRFAPHLPGVVDLPVAAEVGRRVGLPVVVGNDNTAAAIAEHRIGAGRGAPDLLFVGFGTGIGGAFLSAGRPVLGANGFAGELGHVVVDPAGVDCVCGRRGCWETTASGTALAARPRPRAGAEPKPSSPRPATVTPARSTWSGRGAPGSHAAWPIS